MLSFGVSFFFEEFCYDFELFVFVYCYGIFPLGMSPSMLEYSSSVQSDMGFSPKT
jgi:hypothetical protein